MTPGCVHIVGAGPGDPELLTLKGRKIISKADVIIYAGSLVPPGILKFATKKARFHDSAKMTLEEMTRVITKAVRDGQRVVRLSSGDPCLYGASAELIDALARHEIEVEIIPGVSSFSAAAAALRCELTVPGVSQTVILTRGRGRTPVPAREELKSLARHRTTLVLFLSSHMGRAIQRQLLAGGYPAHTPVAIVSKASRQDEQIFRGPLSDLSKMLTRGSISGTALILVGAALGKQRGKKRDRRSRLYDPHFAHGFRGIKT